MALTPEHYARLDATALADAIRQGDTSPEQVLDCAAAMIDLWQPRLNAITWLDLNSARKQLERLDRNAPFAGVPLLLKDIRPHDFMGMPTSNGCAALKDSIANHHSHLVRRLVNAGFIILGKTSTPEFGLKATTEPAAFGPTHNPWHPDYTAGGSSGGSAAAVAAGIVPLATASDGGGSIRIPSAYCGLYGLKPSRARVSAGPDRAPGWDGLTCDHVLTRSVRDSAAVLDLLAGPEADDPYGIHTPAASFAETCAQAPQPLRIGIWRQSPLGGEVDDEHLAALDRVARTLADTGHTLVNIAPQYDGAALARCYLMVYAGHMAAEVEAMRQQGLPVDTGVELDTRILAALGESYSAGDYVRAGRLWQGFHQAMASLFSQVDLLISPTTALPPAKLGEQALPWIEALGARLTLGMKMTAVMRATGLVEKMALQQLARVPFTQLANFTGLPAASIPAGRCYSGQLPVGVQVMAPRGEEGRILAVSRELEAQLPWPTLAPDWLT